MTPAHQSIVDNILKLLATRTNESIHLLAYPIGNMQLTIEQLRESPLGQDLTNIVHYVEGYPIDGKIDEMIQRIFRASFAPPIQFGSSIPAIRLPKGWQKTPFGVLIGNAYRKLIPAKDRMTTAEVSRVLGVKRQTLYDWVEEGKLKAYYIHEKQTFYRPAINQLVQQRQQKQTRDRVVEQLHPKP